MYESQNVKTWVAIKLPRLSHDVLTSNVDRDVSSAYSWSSSGDENGRFPINLKNYPPL